jgi:hypothetical protein
VTQAFHTEELEFWRCWHESGRDAALAYAAADRAAQPPVVPVAAIDSAKARFEATRTARKAAAAAASTPATAAPNPAIPAAAAATSTRALTTTKPALAANLAKLDKEHFKALFAHSDNATHLKSSGNLHYWSEKHEALRLDGFIEQIMVEYGCPGGGKGPWDGVGAVVKTKMRNDIINEIARKAKTTPSGQITNAREVHYCSLHVLFTTAHHCYSLLLATARYCSLLLATAHYCSLLLTTAHYYSLLTLLLLYSGGNALACHLRDAQVAERACAHEDPRDGCALH